MRILGFGKDLTFQNRLETQAELACQAARILQSLIADLPHAEAHARQIEQLETKADEVVHGLANLVSSTFITPLDKEDINDLGANLDDVVDAIDDAAATILFCRIREPRKDIGPLVDLLVSIVDGTRDAVLQLAKGMAREPMMKVLHQVHTLEQQGDLAYRQALGNLFNEPTADLLTVFKWREVYEWIETAFDRCEKIAIVLERVVVKYG